MNRFKIIWMVMAVIALALLAGGCAAMINERQMTLDEIVGMSESGVGDSVIERQIDATHSEFVLTPDDISRLKSAGVSDNVIESMIESGQTPRYFDYENNPYYWHYYGYYPPYATYRRSDLLGRFYFYGPPYPYPHSSYGEYELWRRQLEDEYDQPRRGNAGSPDIGRRGPDGQRDEDKQ